MPWKCPNGCEDMEVCIAEFREDCICHFFDPINKELDIADELRYKVYVADESKYWNPECSICETEVEWVDDDV